MLKCFVTESLSENGRLKGNKVSKKVCRHQLETICSTTRIAAVTFPCLEQRRGALLILEGELEQAPGKSELGHNM